MSTDTEFFTKRPALKYVLDALLKRIETAIVASVIIIYQRYHVHNQILQETGSHFQDVVKHQQALEVKVDGAIITNLDSQKKEQTK